MEWTKYTTKEALKDNDELMILDKDANANKRTLMDKVWDYVVDKMTTAVIAKLGTTNKTLIGAVNELNSNTANTITTVRNNGIKTASFQLSKLTNGYKPALVINTDGASGFLHLILIDKNTNAGTTKYLSVFQQGSGTITYSYDRDSGVLTLTSTALIYGGITCICGI